MREIQAARDRGLPIFGETCIQYLYLTVDDLDRPGFEGAKYVCSPPLREEHNQEVLYRALRQGALQGISTDHCPFNFKGQKELGLGDFTKIPNGLPAIEHRLTLLYDRSVRQGHMSIIDLVRHGSWGPARIFGLDARARSRPASTPILVARTLFKQYRRLTLVRTESDDFTGVLLQCHFLYLCADTH